MKSWTVHNLICLWCEQDRGDAGDPVGKVNEPSVNDLVNLCTGCGSCSNACPFLAEYGTPGRILRKRPELSFYCTSCRRCDEVCPQSLSPSAAFLDAKHRLVRENRIAAPVRKALNSARRFAKTGDRFPFSCCPHTDTAFWPGCGLAADRPGLVRKVRNILSQEFHRRVGLVLDCCFAPVHGMGDTEAAVEVLRKIGKRLHEHGVRQVITGCLNCHRLLSEYLEGIQVVFILEVLPPEIFEKRRMESIYLHHPCPSSQWETIRNKATGLVDHIYPSRLPLLRRDVKSSPVSSNPTPAESQSPISEASAPHCCGVGGGLNALNPELADRFLNRISREGKNRTTITYCIGCQNGLLKKGAEAIHLLECLPGVRPRRKIRSPFRQWTGRFLLAMVERLNDLHCFRKGGGD